MPALYSAALNVHAHPVFRERGSIRKTMPHTFQKPTPNRLLNSLPDANFLRMSKHFELVSIRFGQVLHEVGSDIEHVYFPLQGAVSLLSETSQQKEVEVAVIGNEGVIGVAAAFGEEASFFRTVVQVPGTAIRLPAERFRKGFEAQGLWNPALMDFQAALFNQVAQAAVCSRFHHIEARLARWLLTTADRAEGNRFYVTQSFLSRTLGVRRVGVSAAAAGFQEAGLIGYSRGHIEIINREGLEAAACECYRLVNALYTGGRPIKQLLDDTGGPAAIN